MHLAVPLADYFLYGGHDSRQGAARNTVGPRERLKAERASRGGVKASRIKYPLYKDSCLSDLGFSITPTYRETFGTGKHPSPVPSLIHTDSLQPFSRCSCHFSRLPHSEKFGYSSLLGPLSQ